MLNNMKFHEEKTIRIALVGQPNVGKSMLINSISNARLKVGNFSGVTVATAGVFWYLKSSYHKQYLDATSQDDMDTFIEKEKTSTIVAIGATAVSAALIPITIVIGKKEVKKHDLTISFAPIISKTRNGFLITGEF